jgi:3-oxoacyl-[acyl-carrier protein] reductase
MGLEGRVALVTGGSRGIGRAVVERLSRDGAKVAFVYKSNAGAANEVVEKLKGEGREVLAFQADVARKEEVDKVVEQVLAAWERVDILVNNAGITRDGLLAMMDPQNWQAVIDTNLTSVYNFCQAVMRPMMSQRYGRIVNLSSVAAEYGNQGQVNYAASKGGIQGLTRCLATEVGRRNITVNAVAPGFIETDMTDAVRQIAGAKFDEIKNGIALRRLGKPEDIAGAVAFLASEDAGYVTGCILTVDGGLTLGGF